METLLIRYSEIGLKSKPVRKRFETQLRDNIMSMLVMDGIEALVNTGEARFFVESDDPDKAAESIRRVFGVASLSRAVISGSGLEDICSSAADYSKGRISKGQSFAVKARREGSHPYSSMDLAKEAGSAIFLANQGVKVNLTDPDVVFYIEVRDNKAFIFSDYIQGPGGLPLGSQGKVVAEVDDDRGILAAWLMMKRGCRTFISSTVDVSVLERYDPSLRMIVKGETDNQNVLGKVLGTSMDGLVSVDVSGDVPVYFPTIGMSDAEVHEMLTKL